MADQSADLLRGPVNRVVCVTQNKDKLDAAMAALQEAGFDNDAVVTLHGQEGLKFLDLDGSEHGLWGRIVRFMQHHGDEAELFEQTETVLKSGGYLIATLTDGSDAQKTMAFNAVRPQVIPGSAIYFAGHGTLELLARAVSD